MTRFLLASALAVATLTGAQAQTTAPSAADLTPREAYQQGRALLDQLIMERKIVEAVTIFDPNEAMSRENLEVIEADLRTRYTEDFEHAAVVRSELMRNGFRQELIAYWTGNQYLYVYLLMHTFDNRTQLLNFAYNSSFEELNGRF